MTAQAVCIARHGDRLDFADPGWARSAPRPYDPPLSPRGVAQARELGERLLAEGIAHVFCSPFLRSVETAHEVAAILGLPVRVESGLSEWLNAEWFPAPDLTSVQVLQRQFPRIDPGYRSRVAARYPESAQRSLKRAAETAARLAAQFHGNMLLVGHGASVLGATAGLLGLSVDETKPLLRPIHYCCLIKLVRGAGGRWSLELNGDTGHLSQTDSTVRFA